MKKIFLAATILAAASLTGCGNKTNPAAEGTADSVENVGTANQAAPQSEADSLINALDTSLSAKDAKSLEDAMASVKAKYDELVKAGLTEEAKAYAAKLKEYFNQHADEVKAAAAGNTAVSELVNTVANLPSTAEEAVDKAKEDAENAVNEKKEEVKKDIENKKQEAKEKANEAVNKAADKANKAVSGAINKAFGSN